MRLIKEQVKLYIFLPVSTFLIFWYFLILILLLIDFLFTVIIICYKSQSASEEFRQYILPIVIIALFIDICISFNTGFIKNGKIIRNRKQIGTNYILSAYFWLDALAFGVSVAQIVLKESFTEQYPFLNFLVFIKVVKALQFDSLIRKYIIRSAYLNLYYSMLKNFIMIVLVCHVIGSFFYYLDLKLQQNEWYGDQLWIVSSYCYPKIYELSVGYQYAYSFYWAIVTLTGTSYGDLVPLNPSQTAYTTGAYALPMVVYAYLFAVIYAAISETRSRLIEAKKYKKMAKYYLKDLGVSQKLTFKLLNYLSYIYEKKINLDNQFMSQLPPKTRYLYMKGIIQKSYDFSIFLNLTRPQFNLEMIQEIIYNLIEEEGFSQRQVLVKRDKQKLYFIQSGKVIKAVSLKNIISKPIRPRNFAGSLTFFTGQIDPDIQIETNSFTVCQTLQYDKFQDILKEKQILKESYHLQRDQLLFYFQYDLIRHDCFFCDETNHSFQNCPKLRPEINFDQIIYHKNERNEQTTSHVFQRREVKSKKILNTNKIVFMQNDSTNSKQKKQSIGIQTDTTQNIEQLKDFQILYNWKIFYPIYSFY